MMSMLLMLVILGLCNSEMVTVPPGNRALTTSSPHSPDAVTCYSCMSLFHSDCRYPTGSTPTCTGDGCFKEDHTNDDGQLTIVYFPLRLF